MPDIDFLYGAVPLTKTFNKMPEGGYDVTPYPFIKKVTSERESYTTTKELFNILRKHARAGHAAIAGLLKRSLTSESRAGMTDPMELTHRIVLDLDFEAGWDSPRAFLTDLNPDWSDVSFVFQHSASAGVKYKSGLRGHIWLNLAAPVQPNILKAWLRLRNIEVSGLSSQINLNASGHSLRYPLDITTCQNDKLLFIAPPVCEGFKDSLKNRIELHTAKYDVAPPPVLRIGVDAVDAATRTKIRALRAALGLPAKTASMKPFIGTKVLDNPDSMTITGVKEARGFVYLNLNGGDSWAYYFMADNPAVVRNFKGEPPMRLADIDQDFFDARNATKPAKVIPLVFRDFETDTYYNALYNQQDDAIVRIAPASSLSKLAHFCAQHSMVPPSVIPDWISEFDPTTAQVVDLKKQWINKFVPSIFIRAHSNGILAESSDIPPTIKRVIQSVCGNDEKVFDHFINWLAVIFQTRARTGTAWILHGVQGTGKGVLLEYILRPLLGPEQVQEWTTQQMEEQYNSYLETTSLLWLDEFQAGTDAAGDLVTNKLQNYITEPAIPIRGMRANTIMRANYLNIIIASNRSDIIQINPTDRRFNVAPPQTRKIIITANDLDEIRDNEIVQFAQYLSHYSSDTRTAKTALDTEAKTQLIAMTETSTSRTIRAVKEGDLTWLLTHVPDSPTDVASSHSPMLAAAYTRSMTEWGRSVWNDGSTKLAKRYVLTADEIMTIYQYLTGNRVPRAKFEKQLVCNNLELVPCNRGTWSGRGLPVNTKVSRARVKAFVDSLNTTRHSSKPKIVSNNTKG